jgi:hypothetical protein
MVRVFNNKRVFVYIKKMIANDSRKDAEFLIDIYMALFVVCVFALLLTLIYEYIKINNYVCVL